MSQSHIFVGPFVTFTYISVHIHITSVNPKGGQNDKGYKTYIMLYTVETLRFTASLINTAGHY